MLLAPPPYPANAKAFFGREIAYLQSKGYSAARRYSNVLQEDADDLTNAQPASIGALIDHLTTSGFLLVHEGPGRYGRRPARLRGNRDGCPPRWRSPRTADNGRCC